MQYRKLHLSYGEQANLLISRGLKADCNLLTQRLMNVGYYRLSAYWHPFCKRDRDGNILPEFIEDVSLDMIWLLYRFDRDLRLLFLDAVERIEVALRSRLANLHTQKRSPFDYATSSYFPKWRDYIQKWDRVKLKKDKNGKIWMRGIESLDHFFMKYGDSHDYPPLWMAISMAEFGFVTYFFDYSEKEIRSAIAKEWGTKSATLSSWLHALNALRNDCAHHARVWNKVYFAKPHLPTYSEDKLWHFVYCPHLNKWIAPQQAHETSVFVPGNAACFLMMCRRLLRVVAPTSCWAQRVEAMLHAYAAQGVDLAKIGLPPYWEKHPLWK